MPGLRRIVGRRTAGPSNSGADPAVQTIANMSSSWCAAAVLDDGLRFTVIPTARFGDRFRPKSGVCRLGAGSRERPFIQTSDPLSGGDLRCLCPRRNDLEILGCDACRAIALLVVTDVEVFEIASQCSLVGFGESGKAHSVGP